MITHPQAARFCNENDRVLADQLYSAYRTAKQFMVNIVQNFESVTGGDQNSDVVSDGSEIDGRNPITKGNVAELKYVVEQFIACMETDDRLAVTNRHVVNGQPRF